MKILFYILLFIILVDYISAQNIRPVRDDVGFCWSAEDMNMLMEYLNKEIIVKEESASGKFVAGISPHDDYLYAGRVYYPLYESVKAKEVVVFGVTHGTVRSEINDPQNILILDEFDLWKGPYNNVEMSPLREIIKGKLDPDDFIVSNKAHIFEHSIEALIPWIQYNNRDFKITPIMVTAMPLEKMEEISWKMAVIIAGYIKENNLELGKDIFFLISSDANHYGADFNNTPYGESEDAHRMGMEKDEQIANNAFVGMLDEPKIENLTKELWEVNESGTPARYWCGKYSIPFGLITIDEIVQSLEGKRLEGKVLKYSDTWTEKVIPLKGTHMGLTAPFSLKHWVGFLSAGFYLK